MSNLSIINGLLDDKSVNPNVIMSLINDEITDIKTEIFADVDNFLVVATPGPIPAAGNVAVNTPVILNTTTEGASIFYTLNGATPTNASIPYTSSIIISEPLTIKAIAYKGYQTPSTVMEAAFTVDA